MLLSCAVAYGSYCTQLWFQGEFGHKLEVADTTLYGWVLRYRSGMPLVKAGRPTTLTMVEERLVFHAMTYLRRKSGPVDREVMQLMARKAMAATRRLSLEDIGELSPYWAKSFRKRWRISKSAPVTALQKTFPNFLLQFEATYI